jgi:uridine kinase
VVDLVLQRLGPQLNALEDDIRRTLIQDNSTGYPKLIVVSSDAGAGKSTVATPLANRLGAVELPLDDFYRGPHDLESEIWDQTYFMDDYARALELAAGGHKVRWQPIDWHTGAPDGPERCIARGEYDLVVASGVGLLGDRFWGSFDYRIWVDCNDPLSRGLARDIVYGAEFADYWQIWRRMDQRFRAKYGLPHNRRPDDLSVPPDRRLNWIIDNNLRSRRYGS